MSATVSVAEHLSIAKGDVAAGESRLRNAAEHIAAAIEAGATQRDAAATIGKSAAWINALLKWRTDGFKETPFGPESKKKRTRVQSPEHKKAKDAKSEARAKADQAKAEAAKARAEAAKAKADANAARARARAEQERTKQKMHDRYSRVFNGDDNEPANLDSTSRNRLVKFLGMLGSDQPGERANAAKMADDLRKKLNLSWDQLIVQAAALREAA
jgi:hypothetical protein